MASNDDLRSAWMCLCSTLNVQFDVATKWFSLIVSHYGEPIRHYHTINHVKELLNLVDQYFVIGVLHDSNALRLAVWFHDVIYDPKRHDNESESTKLFLQFTEETGINNSLKSKVALFIDSTANHKIPSELSADVVSDLSFFLDFDLAILAKPAEEYDVYAKYIRLEYQHVPEEKYRIGRTQVLESLGGKDSNVFKTALFREKLETTAKENMQRELQRLLDKVQ